jgi:hypothetical protein
MGALLPVKLVKSNRLTNLEKQQFSLSKEISSRIYDAAIQAWGRGVTP